MENTEKKKARKENKNYNMVLCFSWSIWHEKYKFCILGLTQCRKCPLLKCFKCLKYFIKFRIIQIYLNFLYFPSLEQHKKFNLYFLILCFLAFTFFMFLWGISINSSLISFIKCYFGLHLTFLTLHKSTFALQTPSLEALFEAVWRLASLLKNT